MAIQLIPFAVGAAMASATVYVLKDTALRHSIADKSQFFGNRLSSFLGKQEAGTEQAESSTPVPAQQQPQPIREPSQGFTGLSATDEQAAPDSPSPEQPAPQPALEPEQKTSALAADDALAVADTTAAEQQAPQPAVEPEKEESEPEPEKDSVALSSDNAQAASGSTAAEQQAPQPVKQPDQHRCAAKTKAGYRCRSRTHAIVSIPQEAGGVAEVPLCSVHSRVHQQGGTLVLVDL